MRSRIALSLLVLLVFGPALGYGAVSYDDLALVFENPVQRAFGWRELRDAFDPTIPRWSYGRQYAPLSDVSYAIDRMIFGESPGRYHLQGILFHVTAVLALHSLVLQLGGSERQALVAAALFAVHPLTVEPVTWISGRRTAMAGALMLLAMLAWARARLEGSRAAYLGSIGLALLANLCKQSAVASAPLLMLVEWVLRAARRDAVAVAGAARRPAFVPSIALAYAPHVGISIGFFALGVFIATRHGIISAFSAPVALRVQISLAAFLTYARMLAWPVGLAPAYQTVAPDGWLDARVLGGAALAVASVTSAILARGRIGMPLLALGIGLALLSLLPGLHGAGTQVVADRYAYLTVAGAAVAATAAVGRAADRAPRSAAALSCVALAVLSFASMERVRVWRDDLALFGDAVAHDPESVSMRVAYGQSLARAERLEEAEAELRQAVSLAQRSSFRGGRYLPLTLIELGGVLERREDSSGASNAFEAAFASALGQRLEIDRAGAALAAHHDRRGARARARDVLQRAVEADPARTPRCRAALQRLVLAADPGP